MNWTKENQALQEIISYHQEEIDNKEYLDAMNEIGIEVTL